MPRKSSIVVEADPELPEPPLMGEESSHDDGEIFEEEEDQEEDESENDKSSRHQQKQSLLQRLGKSMKQASTPPSPTSRESQRNAPVKYVKSETYLSLEEEYTRLKYEQTELVTLADQRKLQKGKSIKVLQSLDQELKDRKQENEDLRQRKIDLENEIEEEKINPSKPRAHRPPSLQSMLLERDLAQHHLNRVKEELAAIRETTAGLLEKQHEDPSKDQKTGEVELSFQRIYLEDSIEELESSIKKTKQQIKEIRQQLEHRKLIDSVPTGTGLQSTESSTIGASDWKNGMQLAEEALDRMRKADEWAKLRAHLMQDPDMDGWIPAVQPADYDAELFGVRDALDLMLSDADVPPWARGRETVMPKNADYSIPVVNKEEQDKEALEKKAKKRQRSIAASFGAGANVRASYGHGSLQFGLSSVEMRKPAYEQ